MSQRKERDTGQTPPEPWAGFLTALDSLIDGPISLHCIGGFAIAMHFGLARPTSDIDILPTLPNDALTELTRLAGEGSDLHQRFKVYLQLVTVVNCPVEYEPRVIRMWPGFELRNLRLFVLEAHDLALTKLGRNGEVDRQDVAALARAGYLNPVTLRARYQTEFREDLIGRIETHDQTLELWIDMCWPASQTSTRAPSAPD